MLSHPSLCDVTGDGGGCSFNRTPSKNIYIPPHMYARVLVSPRLDHLDSAALLFIRTSVIYFQA